MTVAATPYKESYAGNGVTTVFSVPFYFLADTDLVVSDVNNATGAITPLVLNVGYTVTGTGTPTGGAVTVTTATATGHTLTIERSLVEDQPTHFVDGDPLPASGLEQALDRIVMLYQQAKTALDRAAKFAVGSASSSDLPEPQEGYVLGWVSGKIKNLSAATAQLAADLLSTAVGKGAALVAYLAPYTGAVWRTQQSKNSDSVSVLDFGVIGDGVADDTPAVNACISAIALAGGGLIKFPYAKSIKIIGSLLLPSNVVIDLNQCTISGSGAGTNDVFVSAYNNAGVITSNLATSPDTSRVLNTQVFNGTINNCGKAFNLFNFNENSSIHDIEFNNATYCIYSVRPYYSNYYNLVSRGSASAATNAAFYWSTYVNVCRIHSVFCVGRALSYQISGGSYGCSINNCSAETCTAGWLFTDTVDSLKFNGNYFESVTGRALEFSGAGSSFYGMDIDGNWFNLTDTCVYAINFTGRWGRNNRRNSGNCTVDFSASTNSATVEIPRSYTATNITAPSIPTGYSLGNRCIAYGDDTLYNTSSGSPTVRSFNNSGKLTPRNLWGDVGDPDTNVVAFSSTSSSNPGGTPFSVYCDTNITYRTYGMVVFNIKVADNTGGYQMAGVVFGATVKQFDSTGKTVTASNNGGKLRLTLGDANQFSHPTGVYSATGTVALV